MECVVCWGVVFIECNLSPVVFVGVACVGVVFVECNLSPVAFVGVACVGCGLYGLSWNIHVYRKLTLQAIGL